MPGLSSVERGPTVNISSYPKLDFKQAGHLRHFHNLVSQPDGEWHHFGTNEAHHEFDDAARYQLATMSYAAGAAHYHRLPALRGAFKSLMRQMIHKMLRRDVWGYWFMSSHGGNVFDPDLKELRKPWADPVIKENIMYSGHLLLMTSLYAMLFDDDEFEKEGSLTFHWDPLFWGLGHEDFVYDNRSLQKVIMQQMEENGWVGVCCEPNAVFVQCNQFPIIAMRYNDVRDGTNIVYDVLDKYKAALRSKGMIGKDGLYAHFFAIKQGKATSARIGSHTAWANAFMNSWDSETPRALYDKQTLGYLTNFHGKTELHPTRVAAAFRHIVSEGGDPQSEETLQLARDQCHKFASPKSRFETLNWGCFTMMLSELGKKKELNDLLNLADTRLNPTWENGGLYYPRNDKLFDDDWNLIHIEPHSGNSSIGYARLNVENGQKKMWEKPFTRDLLSSRPWVDGAGLGDGVDFLRGVWDGEAEAMILTLKRWSGEAKPVALCVKNLPGGKWALYLNGQLKNTTDVEEGGDFEFSMPIGQDEVDIVVERA